MLWPRQRPWWESEGERWPWCGSWSVVNHCSRGVFVRRFISQRAHRKHQVSVDQRLRRSVKNQRTCTCPAFSLFSSTSGTLQCLGALREGNTGVDTSDSSSSLTGHLGLMSVVSLPGQFFKKRLGSPMYWTSRMEFGGGPEGYWSLLLAKVFIRQIRCSPGGSLETRKLVTY